MNEQSLISILMPVKNAAIWLRDCLDSILAQTYNRWELLAVNDHSDDDSVEILNSYATKDQRIRVLTNEGHGIIPALELAMRYAGGKMITRMDADDLMPVEKLAMMFSVLTAAGKGCLVTGKVKYIENEYLNMGFKKYAEWINSLCDRKAHYDEIFKECVIPSSCWMMYRDDLEHIGGITTGTYPEDYDMAFRCYEKGIQVHVIPEVLHHWRDHPNRASRNDPNYNDQLFADLKWSYLKKLVFNGDMQPVLWGAGDKAKQFALLIKEDYTEFKWVCNNPKKIGHNIYGITLEDFKILRKNSNNIVLVVVSEQNAHLKINEFLNNREFIWNRDFYFLC